MQQRMTRRDGSVMTLAQSKRATELQKDMNAWEENRLFTSGVVRRNEVRCGQVAAAGHAVQIRRRQLLCFGAGLLSVLTVVGYF